MELKDRLRDILKRDLYNYRGIQMVDLVHASRGCRFNCFPCCTPYLGGRRFRPRPTIFPSQTTTAPTGTSPSSAALCASFSAAFMYFSCSVIMPAVTASVSCATD